MPLKFPGGAHRAFIETLRALPGQTPFEKLRAYNKQLYSPPPKFPHRDTIDDRLEKDTFFLFPGEMPHVDRNCFELASSLYFAVQNLYPQSNPQIFELDEGKRGIHSVVMFNHQDKTYAADPSYKLFFPARFEPGKLIAFPMNGKPAHEVKIKEAVHIPQETLETTISRLRTSSGIFDFLRDAGQIVVRDTTGLKPYVIFFRMDGDKLISELRITDFILSPSYAIRKNLDYRTMTGNAEVLAYKWDNWAALEGSLVLGSTDTFELGKKGRVLSKFATLSELERDNFDIALFRTQRYNGTLRIIAKHRHKSPKDITCVGKHEIDRIVKSAQGHEPVINYALRHSRLFLNHVVDFSLMAALSKGSDNQLVHHRSWRTLRRKKINSARKLVLITNYAIHKISGDLVREQRKYEGIIKERWIAANGLIEDKV